MTEFPPFKYAFVIMRFDSEFIPQCGSPQVIKGYNEWQCIEDNYNKSRIVPKGATDLHLNINEQVKNIINVTLKDHECIYSCEFIFCMYEFQDRQMLEVKGKSLGIEARIKVHYIHGSKSQCIMTITTKQWIVKPMNGEETYPR